MKLTNTQIAVLASIAGKGFTVADAKRKFDPRVINNLISKGALVEKDQYLMTPEGAKMAEEKTKEDKSRNSKFRPGMSVFTCRACGKKTRETGSSNGNVELCEYCFEEGGLENDLSDGNITQEEFDKRIAALKAAHAGKGKTRAPGRPCLCNCGNLTLSPKRQFLQGHDATLKSLVLRVSRGQAEYASHLGSVEVSEYLNTAPWMTTEIKKGLHGSNVKKAS